MRCYAPRRSRPLQATAGSSPLVARPAPRPAGPGARATRPAGLPAPLKAGVERLSGFAMDEVRVHRDSPAPARLGARAYTLGGDIHLGRGQERHLPHEAWHVVQQMQGRVPATGRLGDVALNEDPALEADADRMGARAERPGRPPARLRRAPLRDGAVQRKVQDQVKMLDAAQPMSWVLSQYVASEVTYYLGKDSQGDLTKLPVHLIDSRVKYLLGEEHDSGKWDAETRQWPIIPKMMEQQKGIPHEKDDTTGRLDDLANPLALENRHAYLLTILVDAQEYMNKLDAQFAGGADRQLVTLVRDYADGLVRTLDEIRKNVAGYERWAAKYDVVNQDGFAAKYDPKRHGASARLAQIKRFADSLSRGWTLPLHATMIRAQKLSEFLSGLERAGTVHLLGGDVAAARLRVEEIARGKATLSALSAALAGIVGFARAEDGKAVRDFAKSSATDAPQSVKDALNLERERGMIANIKGAEAPLLVRIGNDHLTSVGDAVKQPIEAIDKTESLEQFTARYAFSKTIEESIGKK